MFSHVLGILIKFPISIKTTSPAVKFKGTTSDLGNTKLLGDYRSCSEKYLHLFGVYSFACLGACYCPFSEAGILSEKDLWYVGYCMPRMRHLLFMNVERRIERWGIV